MHAVQDETYRQGLHELHETQKMADEVCRYDLDDLDCTWLNNYNELRKEHGKHGNRLKTSTHLFNGQVYLDWS